MYFIISMVLIIAFAITNNSIFLICSALFAIADSLYTRTNRKDDVSKTC